MVNAIIKLWYKDMKKKVFIGIDVSKKTFDAVIYNEKGAKPCECRHNKFFNDEDGFDSFLSWAVSDMHVRRSSVVVGMEDTGIYCYDLRMFLEAKGVDYCCFNALRIGLDMGCVRGKDDRTDAWRIARHTYQNRDTLRFSKLACATVLKLKELSSERARLVRQLAMNKAFVTDRKDRKPTPQTERAKRLVAQLKELIAEVEAEMKAVLEQDGEIRHNYELLNSIKGVGPVNAIAVIVSTDNFRAFCNARQYACYVGIAPFPHSSGTSVKGKTRVSKFANAEIKAVLSQAAKSAVVYNTEMRYYFERKIALGKHYGCVLNAVKFKLVSRMFAVVRNNTEYVEDHCQYERLMVEKNKTTATNINPS